MQKVLIVTVIAALVGCGSDGNHGTASADGGTLPDGAPMPKNGAGAGTDGTGAANGAPQAVGFVTLLQSTDSTNGALTWKVSASAGFGRGASANPGTDCTTKRDDVCEVKVCDKVDGDVPVTGQAKSAGAIQIAGLAQPMSLSPAPDKHYEPSKGTSSGGPFLTAGAELHVKAVGADIPAFEGTMKVGEDINVTKPVFSPLLMTQLPKGDLVVQWSGSTPKVWAFVTAEAAGHKIAQASCTFSGGNSGTIAAATMDQLGSSGAILIATRGTATVTAGASPIELNAMNVLKAGVFSR